MQFFRIILLFFSCVSLLCASLVANAEDEALTEEATEGSTLRIIESKRPAPVYRSVKPKAKPSSVKKGKRSSKKNKKTHKANKGKLKKGKKIRWQSKSKPVARSKKGTKKQLKANKVSKPKGSKKLKRK